MNNIKLEQMVSKAAESGICYQCFYRSTEKSSGHDFTPATNPSETVICNSIGMLAGGNTVVFNPHPNAKKTTIFTINMINEASMEAGGPDNIAVTVEVPTMETSNIMMKQQM